MRWNRRREILRALLAQNRCIHPASIFDPISARIAEDLGFEVGMFAGSVASMTVLGAPDLIVLTLTELADQAHRICRSVEFPLLVDADHGYGNALNVKRTVEELEAAGVAALSIEDTLLPASYGGTGDAELITVEEGVGKMQAALSGRRDPNLVIAGRTSAARINGVEDAVIRIKAYEAAGVDAIFLVGVRTRAELEALCDAVSLPVILGGAGAELMDRPYLSEKGVRICLQGHQPFAASVRAIYDTYKSLREGTDLPAVASAETMRRVTREQDYRSWVREFLGRD